MLTVCKFPKAWPGTQNWSCIRDSLFVELSEEIRFRIKVRVLGGMQIHVWKTLWDKIGTQDFEKLRRDMA